LDSKLEDSDHINVIIA